jgi:hypothetical protein
VDYQTHRQTLFEYSKPARLTKKIWCYGMPTIYVCYCHYSYQHPSGSTPITEWAETCSIEWLKRRLFGPARALGLGKGPFVAFLMDFVESSVSAIEKRIISHSMPPVSHVLMDRGRHGLIERLSFYKTMQQTVVPPEEIEYRERIEPKFEKRVKKHFSGVQGLEESAKEAGHESKSKGSPEFKTEQGRCAKEKRTQKKKMIVAQWVESMKASGEVNSVKIWFQGHGLMFHRFSLFWKIADDLKKSDGGFPSQARRVVRELTGEGVPGMEG